MSKDTQNKKMKPSKPIAPGGEMLAQGLTDGSFLYLKRYGRHT